MHPTFFIVIHNGAGTLLSFFAARYTDIYAGTYADDYVCPNKKILIH